MIKNNLTTTRRERRLLVFVLVTAILLVGSHEAGRIVLNRLNTALQRGDWATADRMQAYWKYAGQPAVRASLLHAIWECDCGRARRILMMCPKIPLDTFVRQQVGDYDSELMSILDWSGHTPAAPRIENPEMLTTLLQNGANPNTLLGTGEGDPTRTVLGVLLARRTRLSDPQLVRKSADMERTLRRFGAHTNLFDAARFGDSAELSRQLALGANPNERDWVERPLIYLAALNNQLGTSRELVQHGAEPDSSSGGVTGITCDTPLMVAERKGYTRLAEFLVNSGTSTHREAKSSRGFVAVPLIPAAAYGDVNHMKFLMAHGAHLEARTPAGITALMCACLPSDVSSPTPTPPTPEKLIIREAKQSAVLDYLLSLGADVNAKDNRGRTALLESCWSAPLTRRLIAHGANVNVADNDGVTPLMSAVANHSSRVVQLLASSGARIEAEDRGGSTALGLAMNTARSGTENTLVVHLLQMRGAHLSLREAIVNGDTREFQWALTHGASLESIPADGVPVLIRAVHGGDAKIIEALLAHGAPIDATNGRGWTALMVASGDGRKDIVQILVDHGARTDLRTHGGLTAFQIAARHHHDELLALLGAKERPVAVR